MSEFIPLSVPNIKGNELTYITDAINTEWVSTAGSYITKFEQALSSYVGVPDAVACQSGTAGLHLSLLASNVGKNEEVLVPTLTFIAAVNPIKYIGAEPIFMDCDDTLTMDPVKLEQFCREECTFQHGILRNKNTDRIIRAIIVVHVFGNMANMEAIMRIASDYGLKVIEDATEALGSYYVSGKYKHKFAGTIGDFGVYSFNGNKIITSGGGGMIVANNTSSLDYCRYLSTQAKDDLLYFIHNEIGYNYRMTNLQAALGLGQLEQLDHFIQTKKENYIEYMRQGISLLPFREGIEPNYWFYSYYTEHRDMLLKHLEENKIQSRPVWALIHTLPPYQDSQSYKIEKAYRYYNHLVNLPCSSNLTAQQVQQVSTEIKRFIGGLQDECN